MLLFSTNSPDEGRANLDSGLVRWNVGNDPEVAEGLAMWSGVTILVGAILVGGSEGSSTLRGDAFEGWFRSAVDGDLDVPEDVARKARAYRYAFVTGFRNERMPGYFAQNMAELKALGVPQRQIHVINPSSSQTSEANLQDVRSRFLEIAGEGPERLVVIAHSRGACDTLAFALGDVSFVRDRIEAMFLIQGPFGGSGIADYVAGSGRPMDRRMALRHRIIAGLMARLARPAARKLGLEVIEGMTPEASRAFWARALAGDPEELALVGSKTFYVRSSIHPSRLGFGRRAIAWYLRAYHGPNDGMVALADQSLPGLGTVIATIEAGHSDLTHKFPSSRGRRGYRRALTRSVVMAVGRPESEPTAIRVDPSSPTGGRLDLPEDPVPERKPGLKGRFRRKAGVAPSRGVVPADG